LGAKRLNIDSLIRRRFYKYKKEFHLENVTLMIRDNRFRYPGKIFIYPGEAEQPLEGACAVVHISRLRAREAYETCPMLLDILILHELRHYRLFLNGEDINLADVEMRKDLEELKEKAEHRKKECVEA
jgi:hypothetical protein